MVPPFDVPAFTDALFALVLDPDEADVLGERGARLDLPVLPCGERRRVTLRRTAGSAASSSPSVTSRQVSAKNRASSTGRPSTLTPVELAGLMVQVPSAIARRSATHSHSATGPVVRNRADHRARRTSPATRCWRASGAAAQASSSPR